MKTPTFPKLQLFLRETFICVRYSVWFSIVLYLSKTSVACVAHFYDLATLELSFKKLS